VSKPNEYDGDIKRDFPAGSAGLRPSARWFYFKAQHAHGPPGEGYGRAPRRVRTDRGLSVR